MMTKSMNEFVATILMIGMIVGFAGCTPRVIVRANPGRGANGIRYYRPKPYLKVEPAEIAVDKTHTALVPGMVRVSLEYLPDFSEEYAIDVRPGLGTANVGIKLEDGWNLTEISQDLDSQTDENIKAVGGLISSIGDVVPSATGERSTASFTVGSRNVPIGFYESVVGRDSHGCKRLYGFRYVGFMPFAGCPIDMGGHDKACCGDGRQILYGLTFREGQMVFEPLDQMSVAVVDSKDTSIPSSDSSPAVEGISMTPAGKRSMERLNRLPLELRAHLNSLGHDVGEIRITSSSDRTVVRITVPETTPAMPLREAAESWLEESFDRGQRFDIEIENPLGRV